MVCDNIMTYLRDTGIRQSWLAHQIGISKQSLNQALHGRRRLSVDEYVLICNVLDVPFDRFQPSNDNDQSRSVHSHA